MKVTVCQITNDGARFEQEWSDLCRHAREEGSELVLLPEMPFSRWLAADPERDASRWADAVASHDAWMGRLGELGATTVLSSRPVLEEGTPYNQGFVWDAATGDRPVHKKRYLPNEEGFWEASWYEPGPRDFTAFDVAGARLGMQICTEIWFQAHAREYGKAGVQVLASPRATLLPTTDKWIAGGRAAAVVSGAFCLSSNFSGRGEAGEWGGAGWIVEPEEGEVLAVTTEVAPFITLDLDLAVADTAKHTYPRYVLD